MGKNDFKGAFALFQLVSEPDAVGFIHVIFVTLFAMDKIFFIKFGIIITIVSGKGGGGNEMAILPDHGIAYAFKSPGAVPGRHRRCK